LVGLEDGVKAEIVRLGTTYSLMSRHTSFVAIEKRETPVEGEVQLRKVPVAISTGWHGTLAAPQLAMIGDTDALLARTAVAAPRAALGATPGWLKSGAAALFRLQKPAMSALLTRLVSLQDVDGSWNLTEEFAGAVGVARKKLERAFASIEKTIGCPGGEDLRRAFATALALRWLEMRFADSRDEWSGTAQKSYRWLETAPLGAEFWLEAVDSAQLLP